MPEKLDCVNRFFKKRQIGSKMCGKTIINKLALFEQLNFDKMYHSLKQSIKYLFLFKCIYKSFFNDAIKFRI